MTSVYNCGCENSFTVYIPVNQDLQTPTDLQMQMECPHVVEYLDRIEIQCNFLFLPKAATFEHCNVTNLSMKARFKLSKELFTLTWFIFIDG